MLDTLARIVSNKSSSEDCVWWTCLSDEDRSTHARPARAIVSKLREHCSSALLGRCHHPETDYDRDKAEDVDTAKDPFCQWEVLCAEDVERCHRNHCNPGEKGALPALGSVGDIVDHDQRLHQTANDERVYGDDRKPRYRCKPPWIFSVTIMPEAISDELPEK